MVKGAKPPSKAKAKAGVKSLRQQMLAKKRPAGKGRPDPRVTTFKPGSRPGKRSPGRVLKGVFGGRTNIGKQAPRRGSGRERGKRVGAAKKKRRATLRGVF
jgi:hypothetical protein